MGMMESRRRAMIAKSSGGGDWHDRYTAVEYIGGSGTQYIITDYVPQSDNTEVEMEYAFTVTQSGDNMLWGATTGNSSNKTWQCEIWNHGNWYVGIGQKQFRSVLYERGSALNTKYYFHATPERLEINEDGELPTDERNGANNLPISIFAWTNGNNSAALLNKGAKIYSLTFKENGSVAANFVPCIRKADGVPGMYDTVSETFYTNSGTGSFIVPS